MTLWRKSSMIKKRFKVCGYGPTGTGKTLFALSFPKPAVIDMEGGTDWYLGREILPNQATEFPIINTRSAREVIEGVNEMEERLIKEPGYIETIVIDPVTVLWDALQDAYVKRLRAKSKNPEAELKFQHWRSIKSPYKALMTQLINLPVHLVLIGREAAEYEMKGKELVQVGTRIQTEKDTPYIADIYLRFATKPDPKSGADRFYVQVEKDRTNMLKRGAIIESLSYQKLAELAESKGLLAGEGQERVEKPDDDVTEADQSVFEGGKSNYDGLIYHEKIKPLWQELTWAPGKVRALIVKHELTALEKLGKFLADVVREKRSANEQDEKDASD